MVSAIYNFLGWTMIIIGVCTILFGGIGIIPLAMGALLLYEKPASIPVTIVSPPEMDEPRIDEPENPQDGGYCGQCGSPVSTPFCPSCGTKQ